MAEPQYSDRQMDAIARQRGFPDYRTWAAWNRHRMAATGGAGQPGVPQPAEQPPNNWLQNLLEAVPIHPAKLLRYVGDRYTEATGQK